MPPRHRTDILSIALATAFLATGWVSGRDSQSPALTGKEAEKGKVIVLLEPGCPIARHHTATLRKLHARYAPAGVRFESYVPTATATPASVKAFAEAFLLPFPIHADPDQNKARALNAQTVPEVFLFDSEGKLFYRGRIDDQFADIGKRRAAARTYDLRDSLEALLEGRPVPVARTAAVGCPITFQKP